MRAQTGRRNATRSGRGTAEPLEADTIRRAPTMADVAKLAGVSVTTVSFVLNERPDTGLREETQARVRAAIAELDYRPNHQARALVLQSSATIGFIGERLGTPFAGRIISGAHDHMRAHNSLMLILDAEDEDEMAQSVEQLLARRVDGILIATDGTRTVSLPKAIHRVPAVLVNCLSPATRVPSLLPDEEEGGRAAARMLIDAGHHDLAYLAGDSKAWATQQRARGFRAEVSAAGISPREVTVRYGDYRAESGYTLCREVMGRRRAPTGLFLGNDRMAMGAFFALNELGLRVPDDVSVVGYDDEEGLASGLHPALSTIRLPFHQLGAQAARHVAERTVGSLGHRTLIRCPPVPRDSVGPPRRSVLSRGRARPA